MTEPDFYLNHHGEHDLVLILDDLSIIRPPETPDRLFTGKYCQVRAWKEKARYNQNERWLFFPSWVDIGIKLNEASDRELIAKFISDRPNVDFFYKIKSFEQVCRWVCCKDCAVKIARGFLSGRGQPDDPFLRQLKEGLIDQFTYDYVWAEVDSYDNLWQLLLRRGDKIKQICLANNLAYPFRNHRELLQEMIKEDLEGEFSMCFKERYIYQSSHIAEIAKFRSKVKLSKEEQKRFKRLTDQHVPFAPWLSRVLYIAERLAPRDSEVAQRFAVHKENIRALTNLQIKRDCDPTLKHHKTSTHSWDNGTCKEGIINWRA